MADIKSTSDIIFNFTSEEIATDFYMIPGWNHKGDSVNFVYKNRGKNAEDRNVFELIKIESA